MAQTASEQPGGGPPVPRISRARTFAYWTTAFVVVLAVGLTCWFFYSTRIACACAGPVPNVEVVNTAAIPASIHWQSNLLFGTPIFGDSGDQLLPSCGLFARFFRPGSLELTIASSGTSRSFNLAVDRSTRLQVTIAPDGTIAEATPGEQPPSPYCGS